VEGKDKDEKIVLAAIKTLSNAKVCTESGIRISVRFPDSAIG
jgi:hypothetical protein